MQREHVLKRALADSTALQPWQMAYCLDFSWALVSFTMRNTSESRAFLYSSHALRSCSRNASSVAAATPRLAAL